MCKEESKAPTNSMSLLSGTIVGVGWLLVAGSVLVSGRPSALHLVIAAIWLLSSAILLWDRGFPRRREGLMASWPGPLWVAVADRLLSAYVLPISPTMAILLGGLASAAWAAWFFAGYGCVAPFAALAALSPRSRQPLLQSLQEDYPWRLWWAASAFFIVLALVRLALVEGLVFLAARFMS
jgi:hypothetical protein